MKTYNNLCTCGKAQMFGVGDILQNGDSNRVILAFEHIDGQCRYSISADVIGNQTEFLITTWIADRIYTLIESQIEDI